MYPPGFAIVSQNKALVFSSIAVDTAFSSSVSTNFTSHPNRLIVVPNCVTVPPYNRVEATTFIPGDINGNKAIICAAWPLEQATAPTPPSRVATLSCKTAIVGFVSRE